MMGLQQCTRPAVLGRGSDIGSSTSSGTKWANESQIRRRPGESRADGYKQLLRHLVDDWARLPKKVVPSSDMLRGGAWNL